MEEFRLCAVDGMSTRLPNKLNISQHFGVQKERYEQGQCMLATTSTSYDVLNKIIIDLTPTQN